MIDLEEQGRPVAWGQQPAPLPARAARRRLGDRSAGRAALLVLVGVACGVDASFVPHEEGPPTDPALVAPIPKARPRRPSVDGFLLPFLCGTAVRVTQGNDSPFSHRDAGIFAWDFGIPRGTPLVAMADGDVIAASGGTLPGDPCWAGGGEECANDANYVLLDHRDGTATLYMHLDAPTVVVGAHVEQGDEIGLSGSTGWSSGPHLHVQRQLLCGSWWCPSVLTPFHDVEGGFPATGSTVVSGNCPDSPAVEPVLMASGVAGAAPLRQ
jgi:murein DD-endopeptidase MepM/ murein hydrolase activator NlpD